MQCEICGKKLITEYTTDKGVVLCKHHYDNWAEAKNIYNEKRTKKVKKVFKSNQYIRAKLNKLKEETSKGKKYSMTDYEIMRWFNMYPKWKDYYEKLRVRTIQMLAEGGYL